MEKKMKKSKLLACVLSLLAAGFITAGAANAPITAYAQETPAQEHQEGQEQEQTADYGLVTDSQSNGKLSVKWNVTEGAVGYELTLKKGEAVISSQTPGADAAAWEFSEVDGNADYVISLTPLFAGEEGADPVKGDAQDISVYQPLYDPEVTVTSTYNTARVSWKKVYGATGYTVYAYDKDTKEYDKVADVAGDDTSYTVYNLTQGKAYYFAVMAMSGEGEQLAFTEYKGKEKETVTKLATPKITDITGNVNIVTVKWEIQPDIDGYQLWKLDKATNTYVKITNIANTKTKLSTDAYVTPGEECVYKMRTYKKVNGAWRFSPFTGTVKVTPNFKTPEITSLKNDVNKLTPKWKKQSAVDGYEVYLKNSSLSDFTKVKTVKGADTKTVTFSKSVALKVKNQVKIRSYKTVGGKKYYSDFSKVTSITPKLTKSTVKKVTNDVNKLTVTWKSQGNVSGYEIYLKNADTSKKYVLVKTADKAKTSVTFSKKVLFNKNNKIKVRAYKKLGGETYYSSFSAVTTYKPTLKKPVISSLKVSPTTNKMTVKWTKKDSVSGYQVYMYDPAVGKYVKLSNVSKDKVKYSNTKKIPKNATINIKIRSYKKLGGKTYYSKYSKALSVKTMEAKCTIVLDPGHLKGGNYTNDDYDNVIGSYSEATMSLTLAKFMRTYLEDYGFKVILTRETDSDYNLALDDRGNMAKGADFLLSLHSNAAGSGAQAVYSYCSIDKKVNDLGALLSAAVAKTMGVPDGGVINLVGDNGLDYYCVLRNAKKNGVSSIMVEHSYHTNDYSRNWLLNSDNLKKLAKAEADVLAKYFGLA